jgi:hypothetical protein
MGRFRLMKEVLGAHYFLVKIWGEIVEVRFIDFCLEGNTKTICYAMYLER